MEDKITFYIDSVVFGFVDMLYMIKIYFGYLLYLIDTLVEKIYDRLFEKAMKLDGDEFVKRVDRAGRFRSYGLQAEIFADAAGYASAFADYEEDAFTWKSYCGYGIFREVFVGYMKKITVWLDRPARFSILLLAVLFAALLSVLFFLVL